MTSAKEHKNKLRKIGGYSLPVLLTLLFLYFAFRGIDLQRSFLIIAEVSFLWLVIYLITFFLSHYARALRWKVMIKDVKPDVSSFNLFSAVMIGYGVNCVVPRLGEVYRGMFLGRWEKLSRSTMIGTVIVERVVDLASFAFASLISVYFYSGDLFKEIIWLKPSLIIGFALILFFIAIIIILIKFEQKFTAVILKFFGKFSPRTTQRLSEILSTLIDGFSSIKSVKDYLLIFIYTVAIFLLYTWNSYFGFYMLGMEKLGTVDFAMAWVFMTISAYGVLIPTPGGTGSYHIISIFVLSQLYNFSYEVSAAYAILTHFIQYVVFVFSTVALIYIVNVIRKRKGEKNENFLSVFDKTSGNK